MLLTEVLMVDTFSISQVSLTPNDWKKLMTKNELVSQWREAQQAMNSWKAEEARLRAKVLERFADESICEGTQNVDTEIGVLSISKSQRYTLENKNGETQELAEILSPEDRLRLFSWSAKLNTKEYKQLQKIAQAESSSGVKASKSMKLLRQVESVLTIKSGSPQLKIK